MNNMTDADFIHTKRVCKYYEIKHFGEYHDLCTQSDPLITAT